jgi:hypothetical protein
MKRSELRVDPEKVAAFNQRGRGKLKPGKRKVAIRVPDDVRMEVRRRTGGKCTLCLHDGLSWHDAGWIVHLHHVWPKAKWPQHAKDPANLMGLCADHHMSHEFPGCKPTRIPREALSLEAMGLAGSDGPMLSHLEREYPTSGPRGEGEGKAAGSAFPGRGGTGSTERESVDVAECNRFNGKRNGSRLALEDEPR